MFRKKIDFFTFTLLILVVFCSFILSGCFRKDANEVVSDLSERLEDMKSYTSQGKMTIKTDVSNQVYNIEVWYQKPDNYRVLLKNLKKDVVQILLRNKEGVYVLTPHLKKSFKFKTNWPNASGQIYLYQTIISSIVDDKARKFSALKNEYKFEVNAKYSFNSNLKKQHIILDKKLYPKSVVVFDEENKPVINMEFKKFEEGTNFKNDAFEIKSNMNVFATKLQETFKSKEIVAFIPSYIPLGSQLVDEQNLENKEGNLVLMRFSGKTPFTLTQRYPQFADLNLPHSGELVDLNKTIGVLTKSGKNNVLTWVENDREFEIIGNMDVSNMVKIANSMYFSIDK